MRHPLALVWIEALAATKLSHNHAPLLQTRDTACTVPMEASSRTSRVDRTAFESLRKQLAVSSVGQLGA